MNSLVLKLSLFHFFDEFILIYPAYTILFQQSGLTTQQISYLLMIWSATGLILEIPTGILADKISRQKLLVIAECVRFIGYSFWLAGDNFTFFALGFVLWGIKGVLFSGTFDALIFDELKARNQAHNYEKIYGRIKSFGFLGLTLALLFGGFVSKLSFTYAIVASLLSVAASAIIIASIKPVPIFQKLPESTLLVHLNATLKQAFSSAVIPIIATIAIGQGVFGQLDEFFPLIFFELNLNLTQIGLLTATGSLLYSLGSRHSHTILPQFKYIFPSITGVIALLMLTTLIFTHPVLIIATILVITPLVAVLETKLNATLQANTPHQIRATLLSLSNLILEACIMAILVLSGLVTKITHSSITIIPLAGILFIPSFITSFFIKPKSTAS